MQSTTISVVVTAYNHEKYIAKGLESILMQKGTFNLEVILGDDCSTDRTRQIMQEYQLKYPDIIVLLPQTANMGMPKNVKRCLDACSGDYIAFCEGDDYWTDMYKLQKELEFLQTHPDHSLCFNAIMFYYEGEKRYAPFSDQLFLKNDTLTTEDILEKNYIGTVSCCMYRTSIIRQLPEEIYNDFFGEWVLNMACGRLGKIGFIRDWMSVYRKHEKGLWSGMVPIDQWRTMSAAIDSYNQLFNYEYNEQFRKKKETSEQYIDEYEKQLQSLSRQVPSMKKYGYLLIRAIRHPRQAYNRLLSARSVAFTELTTAAVSAKIAELSSAVQTKDAQIAELSSAVAELSSTMQTRDARIAVLSSLVQVKEVDLLILDTMFPHPLSRFRLEEFCAYLKHFNNSMVLSTGEHFSVAKETKSLDTIINEFESLYPEFMGRTRATTHDIDGYNARLAYLIFLNNVSYFLDSLEKKKISFIFTLYPGGGFAINQESSDSMLRRIFSSVQFRKVIVTQQVTYDYLVKNNFCAEDRILYIFGGVMPLDILNKSKSYQKKFFGYEKNPLDICFVAMKYMPMGIDKGYDIFIEAAKKVAQLYSNVRFHVVGNFSEADIPINGLEGRLTFHGFQTLEWFDKFYVDKDIILSPNIPFVLSKGSFDGFPTTACVEASLRKVAVFCTDELKLNKYFIDNEEIVIIPHDADRIVHIIEAFYKNPDKLRSIAEKGAAKMREFFSYERQMLPRIKLIEGEMKQ
jgi:glycosyltransferase involved in cell wall biosynthesis